MDAVDVADAGAFLIATEPVRAQWPLHTSVMGSTATGVSTGLRHYDHAFWWTLRDQDGVVAMAMRTAPFGLVLSPMDTASATALAAAVRAVDPECPGVFGPRAAVTAFTDALAAAGDPRPVREGRRDVLYAVDELVRPVVPGQCRVASEDDIDIVLEWIRLFHVDVNEHVMDDSATVGRVRSGATYLWEVDGAPVSLAGHAPPSDAAGAVVARVGPVFTPRAQRGHGYAAAVTAEVTARLLATGARVMLHADADNPTSNGVYQRLGYTARDEMVHVHLGES